MDRLGVFIATCGYVGYAPVAPGTFGSVVGLVLFWAVRSSGSTLAEIALIAAIGGLGVWSGSVAERHFHGVDPGHVVVDEVFGMLVTLALVPLSVTGAVVGFLVFRILDIVKPWPARRLERLHGGLGIMADDGMAAVYGNLVMRGLIAIWPGWLA
jgi:phosphatidylglycerophosphatase A